jgi:hypothetical protein
MPVAPPLSKKGARTGSTQAAFLKDALVFRPFSAALLSTVLIGLDKILSEIRNRLIPS